MYYHFWGLYVFVMNDKSRWSYYPVSGISLVYSNSVGDDIVVDSTTLQLSPITNPWFRVMEGIEQRHETIASFFEDSRVSSEEREEMRCILSSNSFP